MALTESKTFVLGQTANHFSLLNPRLQKNQSLQELKSNIATVILFICNHCPYVQHIQKSLVDTAREYQAKGIAFIAISSNDVTAYPDDAPEHMARVAEEAGYTFPYLYDETQTVAKSYHAACTPDIFIYAGSLMTCVYHGAWDDTRPGMGEANGQLVRDALDAMLNGKAPSTQQKMAMGCNIKWKKIGSSVE